jgi:hypothetical protein
MVRLYLFFLRIRDDSVNVSKSVYRKVLEW